MRGKNKVLSWKKLKNLAQRLLVLVVTVTLLAGALPLNALAGILENTPDENQIIKEALTDFWGDEKTADEAMTMLQQYGLMDEDGNVLTDWELSLNGEKVTLEQLKELIAQEGVDLSQKLKVDGQEITLEDFQIMLEIEEEISRIQETYFTDHSDMLTPEHLTALGSLLTQMETDGGIAISGSTVSGNDASVSGNSVSSGNLLQSKWNLLRSQMKGLGISSKYGASDIAFPSGVNQNAKLSLDAVTPIMIVPEYNRSYAIGLPVSLTGAYKGQTVKVQIRLLDGTMDYGKDYWGQDTNKWTKYSDGKGAYYDCTLTAGADGKASELVFIYFPGVNLSYNNDDIWVGSKNFVIQLANPQGAVFSSEKGKSETTISETFSYTVNSLGNNFSMPDFNNLTKTGGGVNDGVYQSEQHGGKGVIIEAQRGQHLYDVYDNNALTFPSSATTLFQNYLLRNHVLSKYTVTTTTAGYASNGSSTTPTYFFIASPDNTITLKGHNQVKEGVMYFQYLDSRVRVYNDNTYVSSASAGVVEGYELRPDKAMNKFDIGILAEAEAIYNYGTAEANSTQAWYMTAQGGGRDGKAVTRESLINTYKIVNKQDKNDAINVTEMESGFGAVNLSKNYQTETIPTSKTQTVDFSNLLNSVDLSKLKFAISGYGHYFVLQPYGKDSNEKDTQPVVLTPKSGPNVTTTVTFDDTVRPTVTDISIPTLGKNDNQYQAGDVVPITLTFSEPVNTQNSSITVNSTIINAADGGCSMAKEQTYLYTVPLGYNANIEVSKTGTGVKDIKGQTVQKETAKTYAGTNMIDRTATYKRAIPVNSMTATVENITYQPGDKATESVTTMDVVLKLPAPSSVDPNVMVQNYTNQLRNLLLDKNYLEGTAIYSSKLALSMDGGKTMLPIEMVEKNQNFDHMETKVQISLPQDYSGENISFVAELYLLDSERNADTQNNAAQPGDIVLDGRYGAFTVEKPIPLTGDMLQVTKAEKFPQTVYINADRDEKNFRLYYQLNTGDIEPTWKDVRWVSSNENVAKITMVKESETSTPYGQVELIAPGTVEFSLEAVNGDIEIYKAGNANKCPTTVSLTIEEGSEPYLRFSKLSNQIVSGSSLVCNWNSNLVQQNLKYSEGEVETVFELSVVDKNDQKLKFTYNEATRTATKNDDGNETIQVKFKSSKEAEKTENWPIQQVIFEGLDEVSVRNEPSYKVSITGTAVDTVPLPEGQSRTFSSESTITVISQPAKVVLDPADQNFLIDKGTPYRGRFTVENYDEENGAQLEVKVFDNNAQKQLEITPTTTLNSKTHKLTGGFSFEPESGAFRNIYDVTVSAKNATRGEWSRQSYSLYYYNGECLDIIVNGTDTSSADGRVKVEGDKVTLDNNQWIQNMSQNDILALKRDINLQTVLSINYGGQYSWGEVLDRIQWQSEDSEKVSVNYPSGAYYENIEKLTNDSYAPRAEFILSGKDDTLSTQITATHRFIGGDLSDAVEVVVKTLKDKLYLFQLSPAAPGTKLTYTNGKGEAVTKTANESGQAAIYEESGIASDVYIKAVTGSGSSQKVYLGIIYQTELKSQEPDAASQEPYPLNSFVLRDAASVPVYLKEPDGTPFTGKVSVRAGVYRNGEYCSNAYMDEQKNGVGISSDYVVADYNAEHTFQFNLDQFTTTSSPNAHTDPVDASDKLQFVFELRADGYYPVLLIIDGSVNEENAVRLAQRVVNLETASAEQKNKPFISNQVVYFSGQASGASTNVRNVTGKLGPSQSYPSLLLDTTVLWWGDEEDANNYRSLNFVDQNNVNLLNQKLETNVYPFCSMPVVRSRTVLDEAQLNNLNIKDLSSRGLTLQYKDESGVSVRQEQMAFRLINGLIVPKATDSQDLKAGLTELKNLILNNNSGGIGGVGGFLEAGMKMSTSMGVDIPALQLKLAPTSNPMVYRGIVSVKVGNMSGDGVSGAESEESSDLNMTPDWDTIKGVAEQGLTGYGNVMKNQVNYAKNILKNNIAQGSGVSKDAEGEKLMTLGGYFETEIFYDYDAAKWKMVVVNGGFTVGGGYGYKWSWNFQVGPVPMFLELGAGAYATVDFNAAVDRTQDANDYLTELRVNAYLKCFAGLGFDYTVIAAKIGIYGELSLDAQLRWLNAIGSQSAQFGYLVEINGEVGVKIELKFLFISYEKALWSKKFDMANIYDEDYDYKTIEDYWEKVKKGNSGYGSGVIEPVMLMSDMLYSDEEMGIYATESAPKVESRDYLENGQYWIGGQSRARSMDNDGKPMDLWMNAYPQAQPQVSEDGMLLALITDNGSTKVTDTRAAFAVGSGQGTQIVYEAPSIIDNDENSTNNGYGDSQLKMAGNAENAAVVWTRLAAAPPAMDEAGSTITTSDQFAMLEQTEVMCAIRQEGGTWKIKQLTKDALPDMSPVVATNGSYTLVAWRQVASSGGDDLTSFDMADSVVYSVTKDNGDTWSEPAVLYNGVNNDGQAVMGLNAAMKFWMKIRRLPPQRLEKRNTLS